MNKKYSFILDGKDDFYKFDFFDHDLILFTEESIAYVNKYEDMVILGGRSAKPFQGERLSDEIVFSDVDKRFFMDFIYDNSRKFALILAEEKVVLFFNRLFRSSGIGGASVFDFSAECAALAVKSGIFDRLGASLYSPSLTELSESCTDGRLPSDFDGFIYSVFKVADCLLATMGEGLDSMDSRAREIMCSSVRAASSVIGCGLLGVECSEDISAIKLDRDSLAAFLLCLFSLCRRLAVGRSGKVFINTHGSGNYSVKLEFGMRSVKPSKNDLNCIRFCQRLAERLELPFS